MAKPKPDHKKDTPKFSSFQLKGKKQGKNATVPKKPAEVKLGNHRVSKPGDSNAPKPKRRIEDDRAERALRDARPSLDRDMVIRPSNRSSNPDYESRRRRPGFDYREDNRNVDRKTDRRMDTSRIHDYDSNRMTDRRLDPAPRDHIDNSQTPNYSTWRDEDLFSIDIHGDKNNTIYGINKWEVPRYHLAADSCIIGLHRVAKPPTTKIPEVEDDHEAVPGEEDDYVDMALVEFADPGMGMVTAK